MNYMTLYKRPIYKKLQSRLAEPRKLIQVLIGPRQVGKTTLMGQVLELVSSPAHFVSADEPALQDRIWLEEKWNQARVYCQGGKRKAILVVDEIQKIAGWSETVKRLWDEDTRLKNPLQVVLLGSSALLVQKGLTESLAGRFEILPIPHWSYPEMRDAFGWSLDEYIFFGGYPGSASFKDDESRWRHYITESLIETTVSRDILLLSRIDKPALLRRLFFLACEYSGQVVSFQKMVGQLQDVGNTTTLAHYLDLLEGAGLVCGLQKYLLQPLRKKNSSPKFQVFNNALISAMAQRSFTETREDSDLWGRQVESAVGTHLINQANAEHLELFYWNEGHKEVDFILQSGKRVVAFEVKTSRRSPNLSGMEAFLEQFHPYKIYLIGPQGIPFNDFLSTPVRHWID
ncbi:MAG: ATP-binding protein [Chlamydiae bacterium]|nr:ATP-binding protein [Chlamydiota bacterium]